MAGVWGTGGIRLIPLLLQATTVVLGSCEHPLLTVLILVVRVVVGQSYYRCPDVENVYLPICPWDGSGVEKLGEKMGRDGDERRQSSRAVCSASEH